MKTIVTDDFIAAIRDYSYLLERGYSQKAVLKIVSDRYQLDRIQRNLLYRGISATSVAEGRNRRLTQEIEGKSIYVDSYNVLLTITNYLLGRALYIADDGYLRDAGEVFGKKESMELLQTSVELLFTLLSEEKPAAVCFYVDSPVSYSGELAAVIREKLKENRIDGEVQVVKSPDYELKQVREGYIATSDSAVIDASEAPVVDVARKVIEKVFSPSFIRLDRIK
jgi:hypothetical protein